MELFFQMGYNEQSLISDMIEEFGDGTVIASPRDSTYSKLSEFANKIHKLNGNFMIDPQLYYPRNKQEKLMQYAYWPKENITALENGVYDTVLEELSKLNTECNSDMFILPYPMAKKVDPLWDKLHNMIIDTAKRFVPDKPFIHTIALTNEVMQDESQIENIILYVEKWDVDGVYIVCSHPDNQYLVNKPLWILNLLSLVAGIKRQKKKVIVGYSNHQLLCLAIAKCDAIASGNYLNLRCFQPERFGPQEKNDTKRRSVWYYCPQALTEYTIPFMDIAGRINLLGKMAPLGMMKNKYSDMLFEGNLPSSTGFSEKFAYRHYLYCLRKQCQYAIRNTYEETMDAQLIMIETAEQLLTGLLKNGITGQGRDFSNILDVNKAAIYAFNELYGFSFSHEWEAI